jgi:hypothetical protein
MITVTTAESTDERVSLDDRIAAACGHLNACYAALVELIREVIATEAWHGLGIRTLEQWITWRTGLSANHARALVELAAAADSHPRLAEAFAAGELSVDQARLAARAQPEHDADVAEWAKVMTLSQLRLAVRASTASAADRECTEPREQTDQPEPEKPVISPDEYFALVQDEDGTWRVHGRLDADHGAIVDAALCEARDRLFREGDRDVTWVDALVDIAERSFGAAPLERRERFRPNLFFDPERSPRATWTNGIAVPDAIAELCTCDGTISPVFVAAGLPVSVGRSQRIVPERTRRLVLHRDGQCRNPLCGVRRGLEVHHIVHWVDGGPTDTSNLVTLCRRCHRDHHRGRLDIGGDADDPSGLRFRDELGRVIDTATHAAKPPGAPPDPRRPYRHPLGERLQRWAIQFNPPPPTAN